MDDELFTAVDGMLERGQSAGAFDFLLRECRREKNYPLLMETRLMKARHDLGLPLIQTEPVTSFPPDKQPLYEAAFLEAAREAGELFLAEGNIERAWPYFRAIGEPAPVAAAIERVEPGDGVEPIIEIAFQQGVHPVKGLELILAQYGMCRAITAFGMYAGQQGREECVRLLVRSLRAELTERLKSVIERNEGVRPETDSVITLVRSRDWLFGDYDYYVDTSHLTSVVQYGFEVSDRETLSLVAELCEYGTRLSANFQHKGEPPFEDVFRDYGMHTQALLGENVEHAIAHFRAKVESNQDYAAAIAAQVLVRLLVRLERYREALEVSLEHLRGASASELMCPSALQLCHLAGEYDRLKELARESGDLLSYTAASLTRPIAPTAPCDPPADRASGR
jgi:hypothetical protein